MTTPSRSATATRVYARLGLSLGTSTLLDNQFYQHCNDVGTELMRAADWPFLRKLCTVTTVSGTATYTINSGTGATEYTCDRLMADVQYDATNQWRFVGSIDEATWYAYQFGVMTEPIRRIWRLATKTTIEVFPTPTVSGDTLKVPFIAEQWATNSGVTAYQKELSAAGDLHLFDWDLFDLQAQWRFMESLGLDYAVTLKRATDTLDQRVAALRNTGTLSLRPRGGRRLISNANVPDTGYGV